MSYIFFNYWQKGRENCMTYECECENDYMRKWENCMTKECKICTRIYAKGKEWMNVKYERIYERGGEWTIAYSSI